MPSRLLFRPDQANGNPVSRGRRGVVQEIGRGAEIHDDAIDAAVVVVVGERGAASDALLLEERPGGSGDVFEFPAAQAVEDRVFLRDEMDEAAMDDEDVVPAVVIEVVHAGAPTDVLRRTGTRFRPSG